MRRSSDVERWDYATSGNLLTVDSVILSAQTQADGPIQESL